MDSRLLPSEKLVWMHVARKDIKACTKEFVVLAFISMQAPISQRQNAQNLLADAGMVRLTEFLGAGVTAATVSRMVRDGEVIRLARGLYQLAEADMDRDHRLAAAAKRLPKGVVCLVSALAFHGLTDQLPKKTWIAIGLRDWTPKIDDNSIRVIKFATALLEESVETHQIQGVAVKIFSAAKTVADSFRHRSKIGLAVAIEGLQETLRQRKATPADIMHQAEIGGISTVIRPYLEALTANG
jgi:Transcriptional regulator, AbiEi antitoxin